MTEILRAHPHVRLAFRVGCYILGLAAAMWAAANWFGDTYTANLSLFALFSASFEALAAGPADRRWGMLALCAVALVSSGLLMTQQVLSVQAAHQPPVTPRTTQ